MIVADDIVEIVVEVVGGIVSSADIHHVADIGNNPKTPTSCWINNEEAQYI